MQSGRSLARFVVVAVLMVPLVSCQYLEQVSALRTFKEANLAYGRGDYALAAERYEEILAILENTADSDQLLNMQLTATYFYVANSYDQLYKPSRRGDSDNDMFLEDAIHYYRLATEESGDPGLRQLAMQYLVSAYGPDKRTIPRARSRCCAR